MYNTQNQPIQPAVNINCNYLMNTYVNLVDICQFLMKKGIDKWFDFFDFLIFFPVYALSVWTHQILN